MLYQTVYSETVGLQPLSLWFVSSAISVSILKNIFCCFDFRYFASISYQNETILVDCGRQGRVEVSCRKISVKKSKNATIATSCLDTGSKLITKNLSRICYYLKIFRLMPKWGSEKTSLFFRTLCFSIEASVPRVFSGNKMHLTVISETSSRPPGLDLPAKPLQNFQYFFLPLSLEACNKMENRDEYNNGEVLSYSRKLFCFFSYSLFPIL